MKAVVATFNQEKALLGAFSVITNLRMELFEALQLTVVVVRGVEGVLLRGGVVARRGDVPLERPVHAAPIRGQYCGKVTNHSRVLRVSANESSPAGAGPVAVVATVAVWPQTRAQAAAEVLREHG